MEQERKKYAKSFSKISHLTPEERLMRLREQKRKWAQKYVNSEVYKIKFAEKLHKKKYKWVMKELLKKKVHKKKQSSNAELKQRILHLIDTLSYKDIIDKLTI